jgi:hypothetical protein
MILFFMNMPCLCILTDLDKGIIVDILESRKKEDLSNCTELSLQLVFCPSLYQKGLTWTK